MDVRLPDGTIIRGVPDGMSKAELTAKLKANGYDVSGLEDAAPEKTFGQKAKQFGADVLGGAVRGAASIGATLTTPVTRFDRKTGAPDARGFLDKRRDTLREVDAGLTSAIGSNAESMPYAGGKLASEVAGTLGISGPLAGAAKMAGASPALVAALQSGGFMTGRGPMTGIAAKAGDAALRAGAGATVGLAAAGVVSPEDAALGAALGGALPGVVQGLGAAGRAIGSAVRGPEAKAAERLAKALGGDSAMLAQQLRGAQTLVPGSSPTVAQVLRTPQAGILERVVSDSAGGSALKSRYVAQNQARMAALDRVAPVDPRGLRSAQVDLGEELTRRMVPLRTAENTRVSGLFEATDPDALVRMRLPLDKMREGIDTYLGPGTVKQGNDARAVLNEASRIGTQEVGGVVPTAAPKLRSLSQEVRAAGGLSLRNHSGVHGEVKALGKDLKNLTKQKGGLSPARMAEKMREKGLIPDDDSKSLLDALRNETDGISAYALDDDLYRSYAARSEAAMGDAPLGEAIARPVTWREAQNMRSSINDLWSDASAKGRNREAAALQKMLGALDNAIDDVASGKLAPDEVFPENVAGRWRKAIEEFSQFKQRFDTGPQAAMFRRGADGQPIASGGEVAPRFWGTSAGAADNVKSFRRLIDDNPELLGQFKAMVTTEGAGTANAGGDLGVKFTRWVDNALPGLKAAFEPDEVRKLQRLAADVKRATEAAGAGMSRGSNTYQNASNALSLGMLDSPLMNAAANRVPIVNTVSGPALQWMRESARERMAQQLAQLLNDPTMAANALLQVGRQPGPMNPLIPLGARALPPALAGDR